MASAGCCHSWPRLTRRSTDSPVRISAAPPALSCRCSRCGRPGAGASATSAISRRSGRGCDAPGSARCSCCRSARCRRASRRRIRRSARWRSIRSTSRCARRARLRARSGASRSCRWPIRRRSGPPVRPRVFRTPPCGRRRMPRSGCRSASSTTPTGCAARHARDRSRRLRRGKTGGSATTRSTARCALTTAACRGPTGRCRSASRQPAALDDAREALQREILYHQYTQWLAEEQWSRCARGARRVRLFGDVPFMVGTDSADVWANQHLFRFDRTTGTPPDAFSATGQDWGCRVYNWEAMARDDHRWLRQRARRMAGCTTAIASTISSASSAPTRGPLGETLGSFEPAGRSRPDQAGRRDPPALSGDRIGR